MSYESVMEKVRTLPEACLEDASKYLEYLLYQYNLDNPGKQKNPAGTLREIQSMFADDKGWESEEEMLRDMAQFRRERLSKCEY